MDEIQEHPIRDSLVWAAILAGSPFQDLARYLKLVSGGHWSLIEWQEWIGQRPRKYRVAVKMLGSYLADKHGAEFNIFDHIRLHDEKPETVTPPNVDALGRNFHEQGYERVEEDLFLKAEYLPAEPHPWLTFEYRDREVAVQFGSYPDHSIAMRLVALEDGSEIAELTVAPKGNRHIPNDGCVYVRDEFSQVLLEHGVLAEHEGSLENSRRGLMLEMFSLSGIAKMVLNQSRR